jgi:DNA-binding beta-propeller fold protein YncE
MRMGVALDSKERIYVTNFVNTITVYRPTASGDAAPIRTIGGPHTLIDVPRGIAVDSADRIYVVTARPPANHGMILVFAATANGNVAPIRRIAGTNTALSLPHGIAVRGGLIYVTNAANHDSSTDHLSEGV